MNPQRELEAARIIREQIADLAAGDDAVIADTLEGEVDFDGIVRFLLAGIGEDEALAKGASAYADEIKDRAARFKKSAEMKRTLIANAIEISGREKIVTDVGTVSLRKVAPTAIIAEEADIPSRFYEPQPPKLDKKAVLDALKAGEIIPGATLSNGGSTIQIRK
ncbi:MAG: siphovirus Gp157 family protein [Hyphomicrobiales bacterium]|jgi:hypothetical protein|nr:siphovirus Gp157 family protein [Hyphomicrobiales bacterium]